MGGEDWEMWIVALEEANVLSEDVRTVAYSYIGPELTRPMYREGTIGKAKDHLEATARTLNDYLKKRDGSAFVSVNKAVVTQSSAAIPVVPLYISILCKVMKDKGIHEGCVEQMYRLFRDRLYSTSGVPLDEKGRVRIDEFEMRDDVQALVSSLWEKVNTENLESISDIKGYREEFLKLFGFGISEIDYDIDVVP
jgi:enoyl-[acyl-carrier protein] reductase/trans-2-enoyl-CoA reductase (NAD+)